MPKSARCLWIAEHIESTMAQTLATRAYQAANRVCVGKAKRVRFRSQGRGIASVEGKRNDVGMRFVLDPNAGDGGFLIWNEQVIPAIINWLDPVVQHGLRHPIKYVRLVRRKASSPPAQGADHDGNRYYVQLVLEGHAFIKPKHEEAGNRHNWPGYWPPDAGDRATRGQSRSRHVLRGTGTRRQKKASLAAQDGPATPRQ